MVEADFSGDFLNVDNTKKGDIIEITGEGEFQEREFNDKKRLVLNIPVKINDSEKVWTPWNEDGKTWVNTFGKETKNWIGKKGIIEHVPYTSFGQKKYRVSVEPIVAEQV